MANKLGLKDSMLEMFERDIVNYKISLLDEYVTFNEDYLGLEYLKKLHNFLFADLYDYAGCLAKRVNNKCEAEHILKRMTALMNCIDEEGVLDIINSSIKEIQDMQLFNDGNSRTIYAFTKVAMKVHQVDAYQLVCYSECRNFEIRAIAKQEIRQKKAQ